MAIGRKNAVPNVPGDTPRSLVPLLNALRENAQIMGGQGRGDTLDRAVTLRDLKSGELAKLLASTSTSSGSGSGSTPTTPGTGVPEPDDMPKPTGVYVGVTDYAVVVIWDPVESIPDLVGYHYSRIYRSSDPLEVFSEPAVGNTVTLVGQSNGNFEDTTVTSGTTYYYWLRHVNTDQVYGPPSNRVTAVVPLPLTDQTGWVKDSNLSVALSTAIADGIDLRGYVDNTIDPMLVSINDQIDTLQLESGSYVTTTALAAEDYATNSSLTAYVTTTELGTELGSYVTQTALTNADYATNSSLTAYVTSTELGTELGSYVTQTALTNADYASNSSLTAYVTSTELGTELSSYVTSTALANADYATNTTLAAYVTDTEFGAVEQRMTVAETDLGAIEAQYTIKLDVNGRIAGFGLMNDGDTSQFLINAENIAFYNDSGADIVPFQITNNEVQITKARIIDLRVNRLASAYFLDLSPAEQSLDPVSNLGNLTVLGKFAVPNGTITSAMISPAFKDTIVRYNASAVLFGGTRFETFNSVVGTYYAAKDGFTGDNATIISGAASSAVTIKFKGGVTWEEQYGGTTTRPTATFYVSRKNLRTGTIENLTNLATGSTHHQVQGEFINSTIPGEPVEHTSEINVTVVYASPADFPTGTSGDEYEFWIVVTEVTGSWSTDGTTGGLITLTAEEEASSTTGVAVQSLAYKGVEWLTANDGNLGSGVSSIGALGSYWVNNFSVKIADSSGRLFDLGNRVYSAATFGKTQIDNLGIAAASATTASQVYQTSNPVSSTYRFMLGNSTNAFGPLSSFTDLYWNDVTSTIIGANISGAAASATNATNAVNATNATNATSASFSERAKWVDFPDGPRTLSDRLPNWNNRSVAWDFVNSNVVSGATGAYAGVMTFVPWDGNSASTGDSSYQLAFCNGTGVNASGIPDLKIRNGINSGWGGFHTFWHSGNDSVFGKLANSQNWTATNRFAALGVIGNSGYFNGDANYTKFNGGNMYFTNTVGIFYNYSLVTYHGSTGDYPQRFRGNTLEGNNWSLNGAGQFTGNAATATTSSNSSLLGGYSHDKFGKLANSQSWAGANTFNSTATVNGSFKTGASHEADYGIHGGYNNSNGTGSDWGANIWAMGTGYDGGHAGAGYTLGNYCIGWLRPLAAGYNILAGEGVYLGSQNSPRGGWGHLGFWTTGNITAAGTVKGTDAIGTSDIRVKSDLQNIVNAAKICKSLRTTTHIRSDQGGRRSASVIAQDVEKVFKVAIHYDDDEVLGEKLSVSIPAMNVLAIAAVNEHTDSLYWLEKENRLMKAQINRLEKMVEKLIDG